ncbi:MAG: HlyD family efflux transporter periplasmic adaptor subunit [Ginsengibacter sp.]
MPIQPFFTNLQEVYIGQLNKKSQLIYWIILLILITTFASLPFIYFDISVKSSGIIRPSMERTEIKSMIPGIIDSIYFKEGQPVPKDSVIARLQNNDFKSKSILNYYELRQRRQYIHDLELLTSMGYISNGTLTNLQSPVYNQQITRFLYQKTEQETSLKKVKNELRIDSLLSAGNVIAPKEMFDKIVENEKLQAAYHAFKVAQITTWQQDLATYRLEYSQFEAQQKQLVEEKKKYEIKAPVSGIIQGIYSRYDGGFIQAGETLCIISPETNLIAECYVPTQDVGLLKKNQPVKFQIDAFDYNYFGIVTGRISRIDDDYTLIDNKPIFKVRCLLDKTQLHLKNGFTGHLKKGLTLQARFMVTRRSAWQLLFDKVNNWLNPASPVKN